MLLKHIRSKISRFMDLFKDVSKYFKTISNLELAQGSIRTFWAMYYIDLKSHKTIIELCNQRFFVLNFFKQIGQCLYFWGSSWEYHFMIILVVCIEFLKRQAWYHGTFYTLHLQWGRRVVLLFWNNIAQTVCLWNFTII